MVSVATVIAALTLLHWITPWMLLLLTVALSIGDALEAPTWRAILPEVVPRENLLPAIALNGIEFNLARAIGPALGGFLIAVAGVATAFTLNALSFLVVLWVIVRWKRPAQQRGLPRETLSGATRAAFRYTRNTPEMLTVLGRIAVIMFFASPFWALLPTVAHQLRESATLYGLLLTVFGGGAMLGALVLQRARSFFSVDAVLAMGTTVFAAALWATATFRSIALLCVVIAFGGAAWTIVMSLMSTVMQTVAQTGCVRAQQRSSCWCTWVRGRREVHSGLCGGAPRNALFLPGSGDWHSGVTSTDSNFAPAEHGGGPWGVGPLA